ncbi:hypothetical protein [Chitinophaga sancti]|uniref:Uncharacterized protein n=1 Tax=Chitinophaga sancti TaxID=1004 RepID=A0A1K1M4N2_9BACT|nr:hypothetical protein [Chitinophaga sancti]WQD64630.1 hypothetical protein U0033_09510 [Chitinophaga sancti]WQG89747.1 hypothetical protein SR876_32965 [Chitinophaga sancti]SFW18130.1 hypothetical protein SAMN05661012_00447 [Chitinophaga sancti]
MKKQETKKLNLQKIRIANLNAASEKKVAPTTTIFLSIRNLC